MPSRKVVLVARFEEPAESMLPGGPEHKIQHGFSGDRVRCYAVLPRMNPLRAKAEHELRFIREGPGLLEQKVGVPFCRVTGEKGRNARLARPQVGSVATVRRGPTLIPMTCVLALVLAMRKSVSHLACSATSRSRSKNLDLYACAV